MEHLLLVAGVYNLMAALILLFRQPAGVTEYDILTIHFGYSRILAGASTIICSLMYFFLCARVEALQTLLPVVILSKAVIFLMVSAEIWRQSQPLEDLIPVAMVNTLFAVVLIGLYLH